MPLIEFLKVDKHKSAVNQLKQVLGKIRNEEERKRHRYYVPRVLQESKITVAEPEKNEINSLTNL